METKKGGKKNLTERAEEATCPPSCEKKDVLIMNIPNA